MAISQSVYNYLGTKTVDLVGGFLGSRIKTNAARLGKGGGETYWFKEKEKKKSILKVSV